MNFKKIIHDTTESIAQQEGLKRSKQLNRLKNSVDNGMQQQIIKAHHNTAAPTDNEKLEKAETEVTTEIEIETEVTTEIVSIQQHEAFSFQ